MLRRSTFAVAAYVLLALAATDASATAQRTFVASYGNDANPCLLTLPCRTLAAAVAQTIAGGEVVVLDSAGYGTVTITQSVSLVSPPGVYAGITVATGTTGVAVDGPGINVSLHGLSINGSAANGAGIRMINGSSLTVDNCTISNLGGAVIVETAASVGIAGVAIRKSFIGVSVGFGAVASITNTQIINSTFSAILSSSAPSAATTTNIFVTNTVVTGGEYCILNTPGIDANGNISATRVTVSGCQFAVVNEPATAGSVTLSDSMISGNAHGLVQWTEGIGAFQTLGNNHLSGNTTDTFGTITTIGGK
jgi:hypothetical protein